MDLEIVGLEMPNNGRSCCQHEVCGRFVSTGDVLRLVRCVVTVNGIMESAVKCVKVVDASDGCTVALVPIVLAGLPKVQDNVIQFVMVMELYKDSKNTHKRRKSHQNHDMAGVALLSEIEQNE